MSKNLVAALVAGSLLALSAPALAGGYLSDEDLKQLPADTKGSCIVAAQIFSQMGRLDDVKLATPAKELEKTDGFTGGLLSLAGETFAFVNVPKGPFRVDYLKFTTVVAPASLTSKVRTEEREFNNLGVGHVMSGRGEGGTAMSDVPLEMSGTCDGGFIWLGHFKGDKGGLISKPSLKLTSDTVDEGNAKRSIKKQLEGTAWADEIDHPVENKPLKQGQILEGKVDVAAATKSVAAIAGQTHNVNAPKGDAGAVEAATGLYVLQTVNGQPLPYFYAANKCTMKDATTELKGDASYATTANIECAGTTYPFPTSGYYGIVGGVLTYAVKVGPVVPPGSVTKVDGDTITTVTGADTYVYKKK